MTPDEDMNPNVSVSTAASIRTLQILSMALIGGMTIITIVMLFVRQSMTDPINLADETTVWIFRGVAGFILIVNVLIALFLAPALCPKVRPETSSNASADADAAILAGVSARHLVRCGLLEGMSIIGVVLYVASGDPVLLTLPAVGLTLMVMLFPTQARVEESFQQIRREFEEKNRE